MNDISTIYNDLMTVCENENPSPFPIWTFSSANSRRADGKEKKDWYNVSKKGVTLSLHRRNGIIYLVFSLISTFRRRLLLLLVHHIRWRRSADFSLHFFLFLDSYCQKGCSWHPSFFRWCLYAEVSVYLFYVTLHWIESIGSVLAVYCPQVCSSDHLIVSCVGRVYQTCQGVFPGFICFKRRPEPKIISLSQYHPFRDDTDLCQPLFRLVQSAIEYTDCISDEYPGYDTKQSDDEASVLELLGMWRTPSLSLLPGPLWLVMVVPDS